MASTSATRGQIIRIRLRNFMSYDDIELRPGFHLNLIIGPNGTGKSTFICAVVLALGGKVKTLGRADQLSAYVKNGCNESVIDVELHDTLEGNVLITRTISSSNHSQFYINGKAVSGAKVQDVQKKFKIQIDNLCTFLPQERVQDFSKLDPQQLLDQTQKTACHDGLISTFDQLKKIQFTIKQKEKQINKLEERSESEKQKNNRLRDKVNSFLEKQALCEKLTLINQKKAWLSYHNELLRLKDVAKDCKLAEKKFHKKNEDYLNISNELTHFEKNLKIAQEDYLKLKNDVAAKKSVIEDKLKRLREQVENFEDFDNVMQAKLMEEDNKKIELKQYMETLDKLKNDFHNFELENGTDLEISAKENEIRLNFEKIHGEEVKLNEMKVNFEDELEGLQKEIRDVIAEYKLLERRKNIRLEYIKRYEPDVFKAIEWLQLHRSLFQSHIYNPMLLELDVTDGKMAKYVEARIGYRDLISFTCTNPDDLNLLIKKLRTEQKLKINAICYDEDEASQYRPEIPINQIRSLGFFSYLNELITGPHDILRYLCKVYKIHCIPIGDDTVKSKCDKVPNSIPIFFSSNDMFTAKISVYSGEKSIIVKQLNEPKLFVVSVNNEKVQHLMESEKKLQMAIEEKQTKLRLLTQQLKSVAEKMENIRLKRRNLATIKEEKKQIMLKITRAEANINVIREMIKDPSQIIEESEKERKSLRKKINSSLRNLMEAHQNLENTSRLRQNNELIFKSMRQHVNAISQKKESFVEELHNLQKTVDVVKQVKNEVEFNCHQLKDAAKKLTNGLSKGDKGFELFERKFETLKDSLEELDTEMQETQMMADFLHGGNAQLLQEYQNREEEISKLGVNLEHCRNNLSKLKTELNGLRDDWLVPINELVTKVNENFSNFFASMGCVGEVILTSGENKDDFDLYGIVIKVKFRDEVPLQSLGRHFQSGGERAVATAVYLLSLQELISVPFRFVDEINQGMDPANERRIINLMINVTKEENSTQYFFITPKLLPNIECSDSMIVHCIYSGPNTLSSKQWNLQTFLSLN